MFIRGIGCATPASCYTQRECWEALQASPQFSSLKPRSQSILQKVLTGNNGIETRHLAVTPLSHAFDLNPDTLHARFSTHSISLAVEAAQKAIESANVTAEMVDGLVISTCTGYLCPGLTSYVIERLSLRPDVTALDLVGQGCGAALPNLSTSEALISSNKTGVVLSICVEVCSAALYLDDDPGVLVSACLFGDGAGAAILSAQSESSGRSLRWLGSHSLHSPANRDYLKFEQRDGMLRNNLCRQVPAIAGKLAERVFKDASEQMGIKRENISAWILHPAGREVIVRLCDRLGLSGADVRFSNRVMLRCGNLSSASLYFVLNEALTAEDGASDGMWWLSSFGAGFSCHCAFVEVNGAGTSR